MKPANNAKKLYILLCITAVILVIGVVFGLSVYSSMQKELDASNYRTLRSAAITAILHDIENYGTVSDGEITLDHSSYEVDASITKAGTVTIISITPTEQAEAAADGLITKDKVTGTLKVANMIITSSEILAN